MKLPKLQSLFVFSNTHLKILAFTSFFLVLGAYLSLSFQHGYSSEGTKLNQVPKRVIVPSKRQGDPPVLAYWIYGSSGDGVRILRLLKATYHPRNQYLLLLDASSSSDERRDLALSVQSDPLFIAFDNVNVVGRTYALNQMGGSGLAALLHGSALLLKLSTAWDWFIALSASDYPLMTQDDILHAFTFLPRDLNFVSFANTSGSDDLFMTSSSRELGNDIWCRNERAKRLVVDPSLYNSQSSPIFNATEARNAPNTFKILAGSPRVILSRSLVDFCVKGWDNFPRKLLMYMSNVASPLELYFQTVICNSPGFQNMTIDIDLSKSNSGKQGLNNKMGMEEMAIIAGPFKKDDALLQQVDRNILNRSVNGVVPGKWCFEQKTNVSGNNETQGRDGQRWGDINTVGPSPRGVELGLALSRLASEGRMRLDGCPCSVLKR